MRIISVFLFLVLSACSGPRYGDFFPYHENGVVKPKVVFLPVQASEKVEKDIAAYFDSSLRWLEMDRGYLFFYSEEEVQGVLTKHPEWSGEAPLTVADWYHPADFVASLEIISNDIVPLTRELNGCFIPLPLVSQRQARLVKLKLRVIDIRCSEAKVILHELLEESQAIPVKQPCHQTPSIYESLARRALDRIEDVIHCAR
jgi:hypothetical protein